MCNKVSYNSKSEAKKHAKEIKYLGRNKNKIGHNRKDKRLTPYKCGICGLFHLTSLPKTVTRRLEKGRKIK